MNQQRSIVPLLWKEARQLLPLTLVLIGSATFLQIIFFFQSRSIASVGQAGVLLGLPGFFAVGAGAILIGQERETNTLRWFRSLPITKWRIVVSKLVVALVGLLAVWILSLLTHRWISVSPEFLTVSDFLQSGNSLIWPLHTVLILLTGIALAWYVRSTYLALFLIAPIVAIPYGISVVGREQFTTNVDLLIPSQLVLIVGASVAGWWSANRALSPERYNVSSRHSTQSTGVILLGVTKPPFAALTWQFFAQTFKTISICIALIVIGLAGAAIAYFQLQQNADVVFVFSLGFVALGIAWVASLVFQSDQYRDQIRFLADRGIPPNIAWLSRQTIPLVIVLVSLLAFVIPATVRFVASQDATSLNLLPYGVAIGLSLYAVSQWSGQFFHTPILATVGVPVIGIGTGWYLLFAVIELGADIWPCVLVSLLPLLTTFFLMRRWMDRRFDWVYWTGHGLTALLLIGIPLISLGVTFVQLKMTKLSPASIATLERAKNTFQPVPSPIRFPAYKSTYETETEADTESLSLEEKFRLRNNGVLDSFEDQDRSWSVDLNQNLVLALAGSLITNRMYIESAARQDTSVNDESDDHPLTMADAASNYKRAFNALFQCVQGLRASKMLRDQDRADAIEIRLIAELQRKSVLEVLDEETLLRVVSQLSDTEQRNRLRLWALAKSVAAFRQEQQRGQIDMFGGYRLRPSEDASFITRMNQQARAIRFVDRFVQFAEATPLTAPDLARQLNEFGVTEFSTGYLVNQQLRFRSLPNPVVALADLQLVLDDVTPGTFWHGDWEEAGRDLQSLLSSETRNER